MNKYTSEQLAAIEATGKTIVSASAGSGKTTVMIEKIVRLIKNGTDISDILAVTYTKKAAAQMKDKLRRELIKTINSPEEPRELKNALKKQLPKIAGADISTVHSFCARLIRSHFFAAGVDADFSIVGEDGAQGLQLQDRAMEAVFEEAYAQAEEDFLQLLSVYWRSKKDVALKKILSEAYAKLRVHADYTDFLSGDKVKATEEKFDGICHRLFLFLREKCDYYAAKTRKEREYFEQNGYAPSVKNADEVLFAIESLKGAKDYFAAREIACPPFSSKQRTPKEAPPEFNERREALAECKKAVQKIFEELSEVRSREEELADYLHAGKTAERLAAYLLRFDEKYTAVKRERNLLDYNDLEHFTLRLLSEENILKELHERYDYVFVDEYQDVNPVQEKILSLVARENLFLVGDVKQAIYGFRGSKSEYFVQKQEAFSKEENANSLFLSKNFRSASEILTAVNTAFSYAMTPAVSEVDYVRDSIMQGGDRYQSNAGRVTVHLFKEEKEKQEKNARGVYSVEANYLSKREEVSRYGERVKELVERERTSEWFDADDGQSKRVEYSDIAILTRKKRGAVEEIVSALSEAGIPVVSASETNVCDYPEIKTLIDVLSLIDNAAQDIPLCSALLSAMGDLTASELASIRLAYPSESFFRVCVYKYAAEKNDLLAHKLHTFFAYLERLRVFAATASAGEILTKILSETRMETRLLARENGDGCLKRMHHFIAQTTQNEALSVHEYLDFLRSVDYRIPYAENGGDNAVRVLTMHSSKGLEYPVVILSDISKGFSGEDEKNLMIDEEFGLATKCYRRETMTYNGTLFGKYCKLKEQADEVKNELNLFYVALTRAKFSLHVTMSCRPPAPDVRYAKSYAQFVDFSLWAGYEDKNPALELPKNERVALAGKYDETLLDELNAALAYRYPFEGGENLPVKRSASAVMKERTGQKEHYGEDALYPSEEEEEGHGATDRLSGVAYHAFLQYVDFSGYFAAEDKTAFIEESLLAMVGHGKLNKEQAALLRVEKLLEILSNGLFKEIASMRLDREREFLAELSVAEVYGADAYPNCGEETLVFQGAIDLLAYAEDKVWIVDYKYSYKDAARLAEHYRLQLELYKKAVAKILKIPAEKIACSIVNIYRGFQVDL